MSRFLPILFLMLICVGVSAQVGINTTTPNTSAALDVTSTNKGLLIPRVASTGDIASPTAGMMVYQTGGTPGFYFYDGQWTLVKSDNLGNHTATTNLNLSNQDIIAVDSIGTSKAKIGPNTYPTTSGTNGQVLTTNGAGTLSWGTAGGGLSIMTKAMRDAIPSPPLGTTIYQTDDYPGIYSKQADGWRCMTGEPPLTIINLGVLVGQAANEAIVPLTLDASHHTIIVNGSWFTFYNPPIYDVEAPPKVVKFPLPATCKGRIYKIIINNGDVMPSDPNFGDFATILVEGDKSTDNYGYLYMNQPDINANGTPGSSQNVFILPEGRLLIFQSDGVKWRLLSDDIYDFSQY